MWPLLYRYGSVAGAKIVIGLHTDDRGVDEWTIFGNSTAWRRRKHFSREAISRGFSLQRVLI
jgi:hypothetical protein